MDEPPSWKPTCEGQVLIGALVLLTPQPTVTLATFVTEAGNPGAQRDGVVTVTAQQAPDVEGLERSRAQAQER